MLYYLINADRAKKTGVEIVIDISNNISQLKQSADYMYGNSEMEYQVKDENGNVVYTTKVK